MCKEETDLGREILRGGGVKKTEMGREGAVDLEVELPPWVIPACGELKVGREVDKGGGGEGGGGEGGGEGGGGEGGGGEGGGGGGGGGDGDGGGGRGGE